MAVFGIYGGKMGIFGRSRDAPRKEKRTAPSKEMQEFIRGVDVDFIGNSNSGINVDEMRAMQTSAVYACVKILAETIASLPLHLFKKGKGGKNEMAEQHPLFSCLYEFPNEEMTSFEFRETMMTSLLLWGNAYARIIRKQGHTTELWYLKPNQMVVERDSTTGKIKYTYSDEITNKTYVYRPDQIFHIKAMSIDGVKGAERTYRRQGANTRKTAKCDRERNNGLLCDSDKRSECRDRKTTRTDDGTVGEKK